MRDISAALLAALSAPEVRPVLLVDLDFASGPVRVHSWIGPFAALDPETGTEIEFLGVGDLGRIDGVEQPERFRGQDIDLTLSGIDPSLVATSLGEDYQGRRARIYLGAVDESEAALVAAEIVPIARGRMNAMRISWGETATIVVTVRNELADWERPRDSRYSDAEQQRLYPGDTFCSRIAVAAEAEIVWKI